MEIRTLLSEALSPDQTRRNQAEEQINQIASLHFGPFIIACSQELSNEKNQKGVRQIAATLLKNMICFTERYKGMWQALDKNSKVQVKQHVLSTLASSEKEVRKAAAFTVAGICKVELPLGEWLDIIDILCQTSQNENKFIQLSSVTTLGYIAQELELKDLDEVSVGKVLSSFYTLLNSSQDEEMLENALTGLLNYLPFTRMFFENAVSFIFIQINFSQILV
jgi:importin subunit beta-1